jgi:hypothetical protein
VAELITVALHRAEYTQVMVVVMVEEVRAAAMVMLAVRVVELAVTLEMGEVIPLIVMLLVQVVVVVLVQPMLPPMVIAVQ